ncbi:DUF5677 domain-containing protein [Bradyrhizobium sp. 18BD]
MSDPDPTELSRLWALPYSVETETKIARLLAGNENALATELNFELATTTLSLISSKIKGNPMSLNRSYSTAILGRMCITAMSTQAIFRQHEAGTLPFMDSTSIAILCRALIEAGIMYWYLTEEGSDEEWAFRLQVMRVHDAAARVRFLKVLIPEEADEARLALSHLRDELKEMPLFKKRQEAERTRLRSGEVVYVNGMRSVVKQIGIDQDYYDGLYNYLSAQAHSTPISYFRDSDDPAQQVLWPRLFSQYSLLNAMQMMFRIALREIELSKLEDQFDAVSLEQCRQLIEGKTPPLPT